MIWPDNADRLAARVRMELAGNRNRLADDLRGPAGHVAKILDRHRNVGDARDGERLAVVERFEEREIFEALFEFVGELVNEAGAFRRRHRAPGTRFEGAARGLDGEIDVGGIAFGDLRENLAGRRIEYGERLAAHGIDELTVDEELLVPAQKFLGECRKCGDLRFEQSHGDLKSEDSEAAPGTPNSHVKRSGAASLSMTGDIGLLPG